MCCNDESNSSIQASAQKCIQTSLKEKFMTGQFTVRCSDNRGFGMVVRRDCRLERSSSNYKTYRCADNLRCIQSGMRCNIRRQGGSRILESETFSEPHQLSRAHGNSSDTRNFQGLDKEQACSNIERQCNSSCHGKSLRRTMLELNASGASDMESCVRKQYNGDCEIHRGGIQYIRQFEQDQILPILMETTSSDIPYVGSDLGKPYDRPICRYDKSSSASVQQPVCGPINIGYRCSCSDKLESAQPLCECAILSNTQTFIVIITQKAWATVIAPMWPAQPWFNILKKLAVTLPLRLPNSQRLFCHPNQIPEPRKNRKWKLYAWRIYGGNV